MVGLLDIAPLTREVQVGEQKITVGGVSADGIAHIFNRFPEVRALFTGRDGISADRIVELVPKAVASIIACGCGLVANEEAEAKAAALPAEVQLDLLSAIITLTMPKGVGPFMERLTALADSFGGASLARTPDTGSLLPSKS